MSSRSHQRFALVAVVMLLAGCAGNVRVMMADIEQQTDSVELVDTPFYPQTTDQCGPSALATVLNVAGVDVSPTNLKSSIYIPDRQGSLQLELLAATRSHQRIPYTLEPEITAVLAALRSGNPVLVLQNLGTNSLPVWHYAVVVGYLSNEQHFVLRSGDQKRYRVKPAKFLRSWRRAGYWAMIALKPGIVPATATPTMYLRALAAFEVTGNSETNVLIYAAAVAKWPKNSLAGLGLGNAYYANGQFDLAEQAYADVLRTDPHNAIVLNNLAQVYFERGFHKKAEGAIVAALSVATVDSSEYRLALQTQQEISQQRRNP